MRTHHLGVSKFPRVRYNTDIDYLVPPFTWSISLIIQYINFLNRKYFSFRYSFIIKLKVIPKQFIVYLLSFFQFHPPQGAFL